MKLNESFKILGVRKSQGKKDANRFYYNVDLYAGGRSFSCSCSENAAILLQALPFGEECVLTFEYYPQPVQGYFGLGRLFVTGVLE